MRRAFRYRSVDYFPRDIARAEVARRLRRYRYLYCGPAVFVCAITLLTLVKNTLNTRPVPALTLIARHSLGIYGFHALIIHALRASGLELTRWPPLDIFWIFGAALGAACCCRRWCSAWIADAGQLARRKVNPPHSGRMFDDDIRGRSC